MSPTRTKLFVAAGMTAILTMIGIAGSPARAETQREVLLCDANIAAIESRHLRCIQRCRKKGAGAACEASCEAQRTEKHDREALRGCFPDPDLLEEITFADPPDRLGCHSEQKAKLSSYLKCSASCEKSAEQGRPERAETCSGRCAEKLADASDAIRRKSSCAKMDEPVLVPEAYIKRSNVWTNRRIDVCWINPKESNAEERAFVIDAVARSWEANSDVEFRGWKKCTTKQMYLPGPIRIRIGDRQPAVTALGSGLRWPWRRMYLNFSFKKWAPDCQNKRESCIRTIAVHEFGHALGFAHEQNRSDTPWDQLDVDGIDCETQGSSADDYVGAWDLSSTMNYCNPSWANNGTLSQGDIIGVQKHYGASHLMTYERNSDRFGGDYKSFEASPPTHEACADACRADASCAAWSYVNAGLQGPGARCWLKNTVPSRSPNSKTASGVYAPVEARTDRPGGDFASMALGRDGTPETCRLACLGNARCRAWTYVDAGVQQGNPVCYLKDRVPAAKSHGRTTSGFVGTERPVEKVDITIHQPFNGRYRLDFCSAWSSGCGQAAADLYCRGIFPYGYATSFEAEYGIGHVTPTLTQIDQQVCDESFCGGFKSIVCQRLAPVD